MFAFELRVPDTILHGTYLGGALQDIFYGACIDPHGDLILWGQSFGGDFPTTADAFDQTYNGGWETSEQGDIVLSKLSADATTLMYSTYIGGSGRDPFMSIAGIEITSSEVLWLAGSTGSTDFPTTPDALFSRPSGSYLLKFDLAGSAVPNRPTAIVPDRITLSVFPNPFNPITTFSFTLPTTSSVQLEIFDILGRVAYQMDYGRLSAGEHRQILDASKWSSGVYFARVKAGGTARVQKIVVMK
jgi:hypothetical protein